MEGQIKRKASPIDGREYEELEELQADYIAMLGAIIDILDGARYLWEQRDTNTKQPDA